jgi:hypothetical protein
LVDIRVGDIERRMPVMICDESSVPPLLGETFFNGYRYDIDNQGGFIHFMKKTGSKTRFADGYDTVDVPFEIENNNMVVRAKLNGIPCRMFFDTGAATCCLPYSVAAQCGIEIRNNPEAKAMMTGGVGGSGLSFEVPCETLELGPVRKTNFPVVVMVQGGPPLPLLGQTFFRDRRYTIDNDKHVIKFVH